VAGAGGTAPRLQVTVLAESGARVDDILATQLSHLRAADPDVVVISVGANDTIHATRRPTFRSRYRRVLEGVRAAGVKADRIVMIGVPDMASPRRLAQPLRSVVGWRSRQLDLDVRHLARAETTHYVDLFAATSQPFRRDPHRYFAADRYHPNDTGYHLWAQAIAPGVRAALAAVAARA